MRCTQQAPWPRTLCAALVLRAGAGADAGVARYSDPERGVWCRPRPRPCPVLARGGGGRLESGKIGMPQADLQPPAPSPLAPLHASASGVPPCEVHAGSMGGSGRDMGGCGWATWEDVGRHGFVDGIRSPLHAISSGPQSSLSQCSSAFPRSLRKPVTCPCCKPPN